MDGYGLSVEGYDV
ncbi:hypothetical protein APK86_52 [Acinetobacter phage APK86]|uniref:Uncharacterized protein n=1 Tax=Acinetobacter phage APK86 TaxID=2873376 RepID=A0AAE9BRZ9_9CAUD|nr:hypothetical protein APK86_52 [Acinetobacter phage APK86]